MLSEGYQVESVRLVSEAMEAAQKIGLYLAKEIMELQGGFIKVRSHVNEGTTFSIFLPRKDI